MKLFSMLPFLDEESKDEIVESILNHEVSDSKLLTPALYPFLNKEQMKKLYDAAIEKRIDANPYAMLPFVGQDAINEVIDKIEQGELKDVNVEHMLPFLSSENIRKIFKQAFKQYKSKNEEPKEEPVEPTENDVEENKE